MVRYIELPIDTDPQDILDEAYAFLQSVIPGWNPAIGNLDVWLLQALSAAAAETRDVASAVPTSIFRWFGANLVGLPPIDDAAASTLTTWTMINNAGYTIPAGTQVSIAATGDLIYAFETVVDVVIPPGSTVATNVQIVAVTPGSASSGLGLPAAAVQLIDPLSFVAGITQVSTTTGGVDAEADSDYLDRLASQLQLLAPRPILPVDFSVFARNIAGVARATAIDGYNPVHNLLTANEASAETDASGWVNLANSALASSAVQAADGVKSITLTAASAADMNAIEVASKAVVPGDTITALCSFRAFSTGRNCKVGISWRDSGGTQIGAVAYGATVADTNAGWIQGFVTGAAPATAAFARVVVFVTAPANTEVHYIDKMSMRRNATTDWVAGGTAETGNPRTITVAAIDANGAAVDAGHKASILADLQGRREVNFIINVIDPTFSSIDVAYSAKILSGYDPAATIIAVNAAITAFLNPSSWGTSQSDPHGWTDNTIVRFNQIMRVIEDTQGVDYVLPGTLLIDIHAGTPAAVDVILPGVAPLPSAGTLAGTPV